MLSSYYKDPICFGRLRTTIGGFFMQRKVNVVEDLDGNKIVFIHDVIQGETFDRMDRHRDVFKTVCG